MSELAVRVSGLSKEYTLGVRARYKSLRDSLTAMVRRNRSETKGTFWALDDVSFDVTRGDVVGIIGRNGAGKSTLLKILSRITEPTRGTIAVHGRVGSLLEVGTGFHPELTGRENIYLNGAILGMTRQHIASKFDEIVAFSEIAEFLDTPVKHYSSGMYTRLAFAVAAHLEPDILVVDEVLAVGDAAFQRKCLGKMSEVTTRGNTVLFVSHNMGAVNRLCQKAVWLEKGRVVGAGSTTEVVGRYLLSGTNESGSCVWPNGAANIGVTEFSFRAVAVCGPQGETTSTVDVQRPFSLRLDYRLETAVSTCRVGFMLNAADGTVLFEAYDADQPENLGRRQPGDYSIRCEVPGNLLLPGRYSISLVAGSPGNKSFAFLEHVMAIVVEDSGAVGSELPAQRVGVFRPRLRWG